MDKETEPVLIYLEIGEKRTFAGAIDWPGWCRGAKTEDAAVRDLFDSAPRYHEVLRAANIPFKVPQDIAELTIVERIRGNATTDFGAPDAMPAGDAEPLDEEELRRMRQVLLACWTAFDQSCELATGFELRKGPRGGGRELEAVRQHVIESEDSYISKLGGRREPVKLGEPSEIYLARRRNYILDTLGASARGEIAAQGPRGGARWPARLFVRRTAWHILDHTWEIEDRSERFSS